MLRVVYTQSTTLRDLFVSTLSLAKSPEWIGEHFTVYQKEWWVLVYSTDYSISLALATLLENYNPDILYLPFLGRSVDMIHEIGDVILPNVFMTYDATIVQSAHEGAKPQLAKYLSNYERQEDYYVEDYGLSIGGIVVDDVPDDDKLGLDLMRAYEADIYVSESLESAHTVADAGDVPTAIIVGVNSGKVNPKWEGTPDIQAVKNMITTIRLMEEIE